MPYALINLSNNTRVGDIGPLPGQFNSPLLHQESLNDLSWHGPDWANRAYWPVVEVKPAPAWWQQFAASPTETIEANNKRVVLTWALVSRPLADVKKEAKNNAKAKAEEIRVSYITPGFGKALEYREKVAEVKRFDANATPTAEEYPLLEATRVGRGLASLTAARNLIAGTYASWCTINAAILSAEDGCCKAIDDAGNGAAAVAALNAITWPPPAS
jgi:hypothetical protein